MQIFEIILIGWKLNRKDSLQWKKEEICGGESGGVFIINIAGLSNIAEHYYQRKYGCNSNEYVVRNTTKKNIK